MSRKWILLIINYLYRVDRTFGSWAGADAIVSSDTPLTSAFQAADKGKTKREKGQTKSKATREESSCRK